MILITGGTGYLGSKLANKLREKYDVAILTRREIKSKDFIIIKGDITDFKSVLKATKNAEIVYHLAAKTERKGIFSSSKKLFRINVEGTENVIKACIQNSVKKFIHASTVAVMYSNLTDYGISKKLSEEVVKKYWNKIDAIILRPSFIYDEKRLAIFKKFKIFPKLTKDIKIHIVYMDGVVNAFINALKCRKPGTYVIADKKPVSINELSDMLKNYGFKQIVISRFLINFLEKIPKLSKLIKNIFQEKTFNIKESELYLNYKPHDTLEMFKRILINNF